MHALLRGIRAAVVFLTRVPVGGFPYTTEEWRWATAHFPLVGALVGAASAVVWMLAAPAGSTAQAILALAASMMLTGGFHEDGLADTADALGGAYTRERVLDILKDSRIGVFGALALLVSVVLRVALLVQLGEGAPLALVLSHGVARTPPIWLMRALPYVTRDAAAKSRLLTRAGTPQLVVASLWCGLLLLLVPASAWTIVMVLAVATVICGWRFRARTGGITGDFLGAMEQIGEVLVLLVLAT
ncbi:MAG: adenosylcobinamide-GDP ribazoletransferase [Myxococcota bacterium]